MSRSTSEASEQPTDAYELGWVTIHRLLREGGSWSGRERNKVFWNTADGRFADVSALSGLDFDHDGRAAARVDWDGDGLQDLIVASRNSPRVRVLRNDYPDPGESVALLLEGTLSNRDAVGARIEVHVPGEPVRIAAVRCGEGYLAQSSRWIHVGLGGATEVDRVVVRWPRQAGSLEERAETFTGVTPGGRFRLVEGSGRAAPVEREPVRLAAAPVRGREETERGRIALAAPLPFPPSPSASPGTDGAGIPSFDGAPALILTFADWCGPCRVELAELLERASEVERLGLRVHVLVVPDGRSEGSELLGRIDSRGPGWSRSQASEATLAAMDVLQQAIVDRRSTMPLPTSFLLDPERDVAVVYRGQLHVSEVFADVAGLALDGDPRDAAVPFAGRWGSNRLPQPALGPLEDAYRARGLDAAARDVSLRRLEVQTVSEAEVLVTMGSELARIGRMEEAAARFAEAVEADPSHVTAQLSLTVVRHQLGALDEAVAGYKRVLRLDPRNTMALYNLGLAHAALGQFEAARSDLASLEVLSAESAERLRRQLAQLTPQED